jgi:hypothetical protein
MGVRDRTSAILPDGGCSGDGGVEGLPHKLAEVESLIVGVCRREVFSLSSGKSDACLLLGLVDVRTTAECKKVART